ncbi:SLM5 [Candida pseudojiufengensis]|uniref:SLM5 n=1 Tax=Candida pseudojiufengensis TaxID=497109 RepID=UPI002224497D|nr:SLM5 [Candida pseudojiufengensis]KAI5959904.1 SLM5 [Candida pseudojiufengensis]
MFVTHSRILHRHLCRGLSTLQPTIKEQISSTPIGLLLETKGFVKSIRNSKNLSFLDLTDGTTSKVINVVLLGKEPPKFQIGQSVSIKGEWNISKGAKQDYELIYNCKNPEHSYQIIGPVPEDYPLQKKATSMSYLRTLPSLKHRTSTVSSFYRLRSFLETSVQKFFNNHDFTKVNPPLITSSDCEGAGETFKIAQSEEFFQKQTYLTVSSQLHLESLALALNRVWTLSPCFRAENSKTSRHLCEFWMLEAEVCYLNELDPLLDFTENLIKWVTRDLAQNYNNEYLNGVYLDENVIRSRWDNILKEEWKRVTYIEALNLINEEGIDTLKFGDSLNLDHERFLAKNGPIFVTDYPESLKPFYMSKSKNYDSQQPTVACFDLLLPEFGELVGGSLREHDYEVLKESMIKHNMKLDDMNWYLELRRNGTIPHGGFGMGWERFINYLSGHDNIRDIVPFPRAPNLCNA